MTESLSPLPILAFLDNTSKQLSGGKLFTYAAGTTTKLATFTNSGGGTPNTNPVILNTRGEAPVCPFRAKPCQRLLREASCRK